MWQGMGFLLHRYPLSLWVNCESFANSKFMGRFPLNETTMFLRAVRQGHYLLEQSVLLIQLQSQAESKLRLGQGICRKLLTWIGSGQRKNIPPTNRASYPHKGNLKWIDSNAACFFRPTAAWLIQLVTGFLLQGVILRQCILDWFLKWNALKC